MATDQKAKRKITRRNENRVPWIAILLFLSLVSTFNVFWRIDKTIDFHDNDNDNTADISYIYTGYNEEIKNNFHKMDTYIATREENTPIFIQGAVSHQNNRFKTPDQKRFGQTPVHKSNEQLEQTVAQLKYIPNQGNNNNSPKPPKKNEWEELYDQLTDDQLNSLPTDPQQYFDFSVAGEAKCGTTYLMVWLSGHPEVHRYPGEPCFRSLQPMPKRIQVQYLEKPHLKHGYKCPGDLQRGFHKFVESTPKTKLIFGIRHPVLWFQSFYNFRIWKNNVRNLPHPNKMVDGCPSSFQSICTHRAKFHLTIQKVLSQSMNPLFVYESSQLRDPLFPQALQHYLGLNSPFSNKTLNTINAMPETIPNSVKRFLIDICEHRYQPIRNKLMEISRNVSLNLQSMLEMQSMTSGIATNDSTMMENDGKEKLKNGGSYRPFTVYSPEHFSNVILESFMVDPCIAKNQNRTEGGTA